MDRRRLSPGQSQAKGRRKGDVLDAQVRRTYLTAASDEEVREAQKAVQEITDRLGELTDQGKVIDQRRKHLESIRVFALDKLPKDAATRQVKVTEYSEFLTFLETSLTKLNADRRALEIKKRDLQPEQNVRQKKLSELNSKAQLEERAVEISLADKVKPPWSSPICWQVHPGNRPTNCGLRKQVKK